MLTKLAAASAPALSNFLSWDKAPLQHFERLLGRLKFQGHRDRLRAPDQVERLIVAIFWMGFVLMRTGHVASPFDQCSPEIRNRHK